MLKQKTEITIEAFIEKLAAGGGIVPSPADCVEYGYASGWLEAQDMLERKSVLQRKTAARILHDFLRKERKEADEVDGSPAYRLQDLFDCHVCAGHIIQVYVKGIMEGKQMAEGQLLFGTEDAVSKEEAEEVLIRTFCPERRKRKSVPDKVLPLEPVKMTEEKAVELYHEKNGALLVDVRSVREYEKEHLDGALNFPLITLIKNPYAVCESRDKVILLYCEEGIQSEAAAKCLLEAGYGRVAYFAKKAFK